MVFIAIVINGPSKSAATDSLPTWADVPLDADGLVVGIHPDSGGLGGLR